MKYSRSWEGSINAIMIPECSINTCKKYPLFFRQLIFTLLVILKNKIHKPVIFYIIKILLSKINFII